MMQLSRATSRKILALLLTFASVIPIGALSTKYGPLVMAMMLLTCFSFLVLWILLRVGMLRLLANHPIVEIANQKLSALVFEMPEQQFRRMILAISLVMPLWVGHQHGWLPYVVDSIAQYAHARLLWEEGVFYVAAHPYVEFFPMVNAITAPLWYSQYQIGHIFSLFWGFAINAPWLVNPVLGMLSVQVLYLIARDHWRLRVARLTGLLAACCPWWWLMSAEYMNHATSLFALLLFTLSWLRAIDRISTAYTLAAGASLGWAFVTRPITALAIATPLLLYGAWVTSSQWKSMWPRLALGALPFAVILGLQLYANHVTTGDALLFGPTKLYGEGLRYWFAQPTETFAPFGKIYDTQAHTLWRGIGHAFNNINGLNYYLFVWPVPILLLVALAFIIRRIDRLMILFLLSSAILALAYIPYFYQDFCFGPRFLYEATGFIIIFVAMAIERLPLALRMASLPGNTASLRRQSGLLLTICIALSFMLTLSKHYTLLDACATQKMDLSGQVRDIRHIIDALPDDSLVFVKTLYDVVNYWQPPLPDNPIIVAKDRGPENTRLMDYYPDRTVYRYKKGNLIKIRDPIH